MTETPSTQSDSPRLEQSDEGIWLVFGDGKYPTDPPRVATDVEVRLWKALHYSLRHFNRTGGIDAKDDYARIREMVDA